MKATLFIFLMLFVCALPVRATVAVSSPSNNATVGTSVQVTANATTTCSKGVASVGVYVDNSLKNTTNGTSLNTAVAVTPGSHHLVVQEWDYCGGSTNASLTVNAVNGSGVVVTSPANGATVGSPAQYVASATSSCSKGIAAIGVYVGSNLVYKVGGASMNAPITLGAGTQNTTVQSWDNCGGSEKTPIQVKVNSVSAGTTIKNVHLAPGWNQWGQLPPVYAICNAPCSGVNWGMTQNTNAVSLSGHATSYYLGGTTPYSDVLFSNPVIGQGNKQGLTDTNHSLLPKLHNFVLDTDVYISNLAVTQDLEFDINWYGNGVGMEFGTECNHLNGNVWDWWDNVNAHWIHTSIPCTMQNGWNHITLQVQRLSNNDLLYQSITVNGVVHALNITTAPFAVPSSWWGMTINYQMDGDHAMHGYTTYLDNTNFTYW